MVEAILDDYEGFDWDEGNATKNWIKHQVTAAECEQVFFNKPLLINNDGKHSSTEQRFYALGLTDKGRHLFVVFTKRKKLVRIISARDMNHKERKGYK